ncbi:DUF4192 domain-containing protein [Streptomyces sp. NWU49]|uniref:DUF4192 domain-containing protein n=1 Tax=Streptomyces sp. NWU49 TaxID=2201153 RepID=UPI00215A7052|nr:DUF4192 domain-containing protein [Streptomyces sp. NWU49]
MTNHSEMVGPSGNGDIPGCDGREHPGSPERDAPAGRTAPPGPRGPGDEEGGAPRAADITCTAYEHHGDARQVTLRTPAELADALPYLLGYRPEDSIVLVALHDKDGRGRFGGRARLGIPAKPDDWPCAARQLAHGLVTGSERRGVRPEQMVVFLCREPAEGESGRQVKERLGPLAHALRLECGALDVPVVEALCVSGGRFWSYCCDNEGCCPAEGTPMGLPGTSVLAAAAAYAGIQVRGTLRELRARLLPWENPAALEQEAALDAAGAALIPRILDAAGRHEVAEETVELAEKIRDRLAGAPAVTGALPADLRDDALLGHDEAATLILGLQDRTTRDRAAEWMEGDEASAALRLWRALARRCVGAYGEHAAAPLTLAGWVAWSTGDELEAREALAMALGADPDYLFARLLHQACNEGLDPESIRRCLREEREERAERGRAASDGPVADIEGNSGCGPEVSEPADPRPAAPGRTAPDHAASGPGGTSSHRRRRTRTSGSGDCSPLRVRAEGIRRSTRVPRPRASAGGTRPGAGSRTRPGGVRPGPVKPDAPRRRDASPGGAQPGGRSGEGNE